MQASSFNSLSRTSIHFGTAHRMPLLLCLFHPGISSTAATPS